MRGRDVPKPATDDAELKRLMGLCEARIRRLLMGREWKTYRRYVQQAEATKVWGAPTPDVSAVLTKLGNDLELAQLRRQVRQRATEIGYEHTIGGSDNLDVTTEG